MYRLTVWCSELRLLEVQAVIAICGVPLFSLAPKLVCNVYRAVRSENGVV
jgi:hypothetical protein